MATVGLKTEEKIQGLKIFVGKILMNCIKTRKEKINNCTSRPVLN